MFPTKVLEDIQKGKEYFSKLNQVYLSDMEFGSCKCNTKELFDLDNILTDLEYKAQIGDFDEDSLGLYDLMMEIIGGVPYIPIPPTEKIIYYGAVDTLAPLTLAEIVELPYITYTLGEDIIIPFNVPTYKYLVVALSDGIIVPNKYVNVNNPFDGGNVGGSGDILGTPYNVSIYTVLQGDYKTTTTDPLLLKTV